MDKSALEEIARTALMETIASHTVAVDASLAVGKPLKSPAWGTGTLLRIKDRLFVATCEHVVRREYQNEKIRVLYKPHAPIQYGGKKEFKRWTAGGLPRKLNPTFSQQLPITNRFYSDEIDDLVLLELDSSSENINGSQFFGLTDATLEMPKVDMGIYLMGFSGELAKQVTREGGFAVFPYFEDSKIVDANVNIRDFNPERHFLTDFTRTIDSVDPHGLSGCGIWTRSPSGKGIWTSNLSLVGIQRGYYSESQLLKATRAERLVRLL